jgi:PncC family amidohydrolase
MNEMKPSAEIRIGEKLKELGLTIATAESVTGGLIGSRLTDVAGSSAYFMGGVVAYSNDSKIKLLGVKKETLAEYGAVSERVALEMAKGVRESFGTDIGLAISGIAGPGGATKDKPVGLMWLALSAQGGTQARSARLTGDRLQNKAGAADQLLSLLDAYLDSIMPG